MKQHNRDKLTPAQIALIPGLRLLDEDEIRADHPMPPLPQIFCWRNGIGWVPGYSGRSECYTSATTLTRAELRIARGLPPEVDIAKLDARAQEVITDAPRADPIMTVEEIHEEISALQSEVADLKHERDQYFKALQFNREVLSSVADILGIEDPHLESFTKHVQEFKNTQVVK